MSKRNSDPRVGYPEVKVHLRDLVRVVGIVAPGTGLFGDYRRVLWVPGPRGQYSGKIRFIEKPGVQG